jgi:regulator-associated protein of mTOR
MDPTKYYLYFTSKRHDSDIRQRINLSKEVRLIKDQKEPLDWRLDRKYRTVAVALVICLNIGTDPPDIVKTVPCATLECWVDPFSQPPDKAKEAIGKNLQQQYEVLQPRAKYKLSADPSLEEVRKLCNGLRRTFEDERILFHYNGHGVPKPTQSGEIWVFNRSYTQYIPVSITDIQNWLGSPSMFVYDCSNAGHIVRAFLRFAQQRDREQNNNYLQSQGANSSRGSEEYYNTNSKSHTNSKLSNSNSSENGPPPMSECIQFAACEADEVLPSHPYYPADLFTSCLTTPIEVALRLYSLHNPLIKNISVEMVLKLPGRLSDRRTPLGELNWILTSITDTIAWDVLPSSLFQKLFRQDLMVAALFRNFLLADRIFRGLKLHPISVPTLPKTNHHSMWDSWDLALDFCLSQLPKLIQAEENGEPSPYQHSPFFSDQLTAFELWLSRGIHNPQKAPIQLPIVLQVLLSQSHRLRALRLLNEFLDLGRWAVNAALTVGIFPYVLKLLQSPALELKPLLSFIWARLVVVDPSCQVDLTKDQGFMYFVSLLGNPPDGLPNLSEIQAMSAFILSMVCLNHMPGKEACLAKRTLQQALPHLPNPDPFLRQWTILLLSQLWKDYPEAKWQGLELQAHEKLIKLLDDSIPEVRAASLYALSTLFESSVDNFEPDERTLTLELRLMVQLVTHSNDGSPLVRNEWIILVSRLISRHFDKFFDVIQEILDSELNPKNNSNNIHQSQESKKVDLPRPLTLTAAPPTPIQTSSKSNPESLIYSAIWKLVLCLTVDPVPSVAQSAQKLVDQVHILIINTSNSSTSNWVNEALNNRSSTPIPLNSFSPNNSAINLNNQANSVKVPKPKMPTSIKRSASFTFRNLWSGAETSDQAKGAASGNSNLGGGSNGAGQLANQFGGATVIVPNPLSSTSQAKFDKNASELDIVLESEYYSWCCEHFLQPQMSPPESEEPGSQTYHERNWRGERNGKVKAEGATNCAQAQTTKWGQELTTIHLDQSPQTYIFHQFEPHLIASDSQNMISVWNWESQRKLNQFTIPLSSEVSKITTMKLVNEEDEAMLMLGNSDGSIKLIKSYWDNSTIEQVSAWRLLNELPSTRRLKNNNNEFIKDIVLEWQQSRGVLVAGGEHKSIVLWNASSESQSGLLPTRSTASLVSLTSDHAIGDFIMGGFSDGSVRGYDVRLNPSESMVRCWRDHTSTIVNCHHPKSSQYELITAR